MAANQPMGRENCYHGVAYIHDNRFAALALYDGVDDE